MTPVPSVTERVHDQDGGSGKLGLRAEGAKILWVKKSRRKRISKLKIATYNIRTRLRDEHMQKLEEELMETRLVWDVIGIGEVRRQEKCFTNLQSGYLLCHSKANNVQTGVGFLMNKQWKYHIVMVISISLRVAKFSLCITERYNLKVVQAYAPTTSYSEEDT